MSESITVGLHSERPLRLMNVSQFYQAVFNSNGLTSKELKEKIKQKLLSQKLYSAISYSSLSEPTEDEIKEYFELHKDNFLHPSAFDVIIYKSSNQNQLQAKITNPMLFTPDVEMVEKTLSYKSIPSALAQILSITPVNHFTRIVPESRGVYMSIYLKDIVKQKDITVDDVRNEIVNKIMAEKREVVLSDYFMRLRHNADIKILRDVK